MNVTLLIASFSVHPVAAANTGEENQPPIALLEFVGQWTDEQGNEIDLEMLLDGRFPEAIRDQEHDERRR